MKVAPLPPPRPIEKGQPPFPSNPALKIENLSSPAEMGGGGGGGAYYVVTSWNGDRKAIYQDNK